jgi:GH24 family phage-related lysozyme (muramidase)
MIIGASRSQEKNVGETTDSASRVQRFANASDRANAEDRMTWFHFDVTPY